jgi:glycosyltransferase involved in cell wall biosynthesis
VIRADDILTESRGVIAKWLALMFRLITLWSFRRAKLVLVTGDELVEPVRERYALNEGKVMVSYNGVDTEKFNPRNRSEQLRRRIGSEHIIVFSGELFAPRGVDVLLHALASLKMDIPDIKAVIMGDGPDLNRLITLANSLRLDGSVKFLGAVNPLFVPQYLASADVAIGPLKAFLHTYGTTPLKVLEYMASGCTVVAGIGAASGNLIIDEVSCLCIRSGDAVDLARQVLRLLSDKELARRVRERARQTAETTYDWRIVASDLEKRLMDETSRH